MPGGSAAAVAVVSGGGTGIGRATAAALAADGMDVVILGRRAEVLRTAAKGINQYRPAGSGELSWVRADVSDPAQVKPLFDAALKAYGRLDILVNNAGVYEARPLEQIDAAHYQRLFDLNVRGLLLATVEAAKHFGPGGGRVINISSVVVRGALPNASVYSATKAAVEALTRGHAADLGPKQVTVNAVAPGTTDTEMLREGMPEEARQYMIRNTTLGRLGTPEDIADVVAFLASDDARWITGQFLDVNGGLRL
jgi:3-oxoacyl-[acyl-carrier protein] reductase